MYHGVGHSSCYVSSGPVVDRKMAEVYISELEISEEHTTQLHTFAEVWFHIDLILVSSHVDHTQMSTRVAITFFANAIFRLSVSPHHVIDLNTHYSIFAVRSKKDGSQGMGNASSRDWLR